jgi:hypothetical protein
MAEKVPTLSTPRRVDAGFSRDRPRQELFRFPFNDACNVLRRDPLRVEDFPIQERITGFK